MVETTTTNAAPLNRRGFSLYSKGQYYLIAGKEPITIMARPTVATDELIAKAEKYLTDWAKDDLEAVPTIEGLAIYLGVNRSTLYERGEFSDILEKVKVKQAQLLVSNGLKGKFNSTITKLMLSKHGYIEQTAQDLTTKGKELPAPILGGLSNTVQPDNLDS